MNQLLKLPRMTQQRKIILEELRKLRTHPTANDLYEVVRKRLPQISLGTVYRNLELLSEIGMIQKLEITGTRKRFDAETVNHYHVRCIYCHRIEDVPRSSMTHIEKALEGFTEFEIIRHRLEFVGICPRCREIYKSDKGGTDG